MKRKILLVCIGTMLTLNLVSCGFTDGVKDGYESAISESDELNLNNAKLNIDFEKCIEETKAELTNAEYYSYVKDLNIKIEDDRITFTAVVDDSTSKEAALDFADTLIRRFNLSALSQDSSIKGGEKDYLGGLYDIYNISIGISAASKVSNQDEWYIYDAISKGAHRQPKLQE